MSVIFNATFVNDLDSFDAGTRIASEGADFETGYLSVSGGTTATRSFTAIIGGVFRTEFWVQLRDIETDGLGNKDIVIYLLPSAGAVISSNSIATIVFVRNLVNAVAPASSTHFGLAYCDSTGLVEFSGANPFRRSSAWVKIAVIADFTARTFDLYLNDILWIADAGWANNLAADFSRIVILAKINAPATLFDNIKVEATWAPPPETTLIDHDFTTGSTGEIETLSPTTDNRSINAQPWKIPDDQATFGAFTIGANGAAPDTSKKCHAVIRCLDQGVLECEFKSSLAGSIYFGVQFRMYDSIDNGGAGLLRIRGVANTIDLFLPDHLTNVHAVQSTAFTPAANTIYTLKVEMRGRYILCSYKAAPMDASSYTFLWKHQISSSATGGRGLLAEEQCSPYIDTTIGANDNYVRRLRFKGAIPADELDITICGATYNLGHGAIRELYHSSAGLPTRNLFFSRGIQYGHRSRADMGNYATPQQTIHNGTHVKAYRQRSLNLTEYQHIGYSEPYITFLRRGVWIADKVTVWGVSENIAPDHDFRPEIWVGSYRHAGPRGAATSTNDLPYQDWRFDINAEALPLSFQRLTTFASGNQVRFTAVVNNISNWTGSVHGLTHRLIGGGEPISQAMGRFQAHLVDGTVYEIARAYLIQCEAALALSDTVLTEFRDDVKTPAALSSFTVGSLKTDSAGDANVDGFNERHGWYEITCAAGLASWTLPVAAGTRFMSAFRLHGATFGADYTVSIAGTLGRAGVDYVIDDVGGNVSILQLLTNRTANTTIVLTPAANAPRRYKI